MSDLIIPNPQKGKNRRDTIGFATIYAIKMADDYIKQCETGSDSLNGYLQFLDRSFWKKKKEIEEQSKGGKWTVQFAPDDKYELFGKKAEIVKAEAIEKLYATAKFIYSLVRIFWDKSNNSNSLKLFIDFLPKYTNKL